ncbi:MULTISPECIES: ParB N-terminal domain-containing protein [unclassified Clostridium]|uniref:ParB N-terminal domain-containing protein n=1 Tax=unclassified Clostridium TaxID=2614128 RepID=UPI00029852A7|nr:MULTISPECIES: ParB N-terminal domain-containing protein [unclassified Clostridium]EKQ51777.1 MAG: putative transcriptional regulator [Clostridium sp. Maddingley MBC34-26]
MIGRKLMSLDDMFGDCEYKGDINLGVVEVEIDKLIYFSNHPFRLYDGERFDNMVKSIKDLGVIVPIIVRHKGEKYEILSGHNRVNAAKAAGFNKVPVLIREKIDDEEAILIVTETNLMQRSFTDMLYSERAVALFEHHKALKSQGKRTDLLREIETMLKGDEIKDEATSRLLGEKLTSADETGRGFNLSGRTVSRYLRICNLIKELKDRLDIDEIPFFAAVELSYLTKEEQNIVESIITKNKFKIDLNKSKLLRDYSEKKKFNTEVVCSILSGDIGKKIKFNNPVTIKLKSKMLSKYFAPEVNKREIEEIIDKALKLYFDNERNIIQ